MCRVPSQNRVAAGPPVRAAAGLARGTPTLWTPSQHRPSRLGDRMAANTAPCAMCCSAPSNLFGRGDRVYIHFFPLSVTDCELRELAGRVWVQRGSQTTFPRCDQNHSKVFCSFANLFKDRRQACHCASHWHRGACQQGTRQMHESTQQLVPTPRAVSHGA